MFYTYILKSKVNGRMYTGSTSDLRKRLKEHNDGKSTFTKRDKPYELIYYEACMNKQDSESRELQLKSGIGKRYLKNRLRGFLSQTG